MQPNEKQIMQQKAKQSFKERFEVHKAAQSLIDLLCTK